MNKINQNPLSEQLPDYFQPDRQSEQALHIIPLGGVSEFGQNMMAYRYDDEIIIVDCGGMFPDASLMGVDFIIPDMEFLKQYKHMVKALVLTHGHEDHIGATPFFLRDFPVDVYGTPFTLKLVDSKLKEHELPNISEKLHEINAGDTIHFKNFNISFLHVNHSICQSVSLAIETPEGMVVHTGDFRIDSNPVNGKMFDYAGFSKLGDNGVLALLSDSTNVESPGFTRSETEVTDELEEILSQTKERIFISLFSSSIPRINETLKLAAKYNRKVHIAGRSLERSTGIAREMGLLQAEDSLFVDCKQVDALPSDEVLVILTGSQGEPRSVLSRIAMNNHKDIHLHENDVVILSVRIIPGHERSVSNIVNHLSMHGAKVYYERNSTIHTSGHGYAGELATMINLCRPEYFIPIHGDFHMLKSHGELAVKCGVDPDNVLLSQNGDIIQFDDNGCCPVGRVITGRIFVDGNGVGEVGPDTIRERRKIGMTGVVVAILIIRQSNGKVLFGPELISKGFIFEDDANDTLKEGKKKVLNSLASMNLETQADLDEVKEEMRIVLRRHFNKTLERKPVVIPIVMAM